MGAHANMYFADTCSFNILTRIPGTKRFIGKCFKISNTFFLSVLKLMYVPRAGNHKMPVWLANREYPDQTADLGLLCLSLSFRQAICVRNFRMCTTSEKRGGSSVEYLTQN